MQPTPSAPDQFSSGTATQHLAAAEASLFLIESLLLMLHDRQVLTKDDLLELVRTAVDSKRDLIENDQHREISTVAAGLLKRIENSIVAAAAPLPSPEPGRRF